MLSASLIYNYLIHKNYDKNNIHIIYQKDKKHGLNEDIIDEILWNKDKLVIIPDANVNKQEYADILSDNGRYVLALDHHPTERFENTITINNQHSDKVINKSLCGCGIVYKFVSYCCKQENDNYYQSLLDMVAFANIADIMDCKTYENRFFLYWGLKRIYNPFLQALCKECIKGDITQIEISWNIVPLINAVQRSNNQALKQAIFECFTYQRDDYKNIIKQMKSAHKQQNDEVKQLLNDIDIIEYNKLIVGQGANTANYSGLIANRLMNKYNKPTFVIHYDDNNNLLGSCRSPFDYKDICNESNKFIFANGHQRAFGINFSSTNISSIINYLNDDNIILPPYKVCKKYIGDYHIPQYLFSYFNQYKSLWGNELVEPEYYFEIIIPSYNIKYNRIKSTIYFDYDNVRYFKEYCTAEFRDNLLNNVGNVKFKLIGTLTTNSYNNNTYNQVIIKKLEYEVI